MDTYFDIRRFGRLMRYDLVANSRHLAFLLIAVSVGLYALLFLNFYKAFTVTYSVGEMESRVGDIASFFLLVLFVFSAYSPSLVCSRLSDKAASTAYWLLPASPLEKFLVRFLLSAFGAVGLVVCAMLMADALFMLTCLAAGLPGVTSVSLAVAGLLGDTLGAFARRELPPGPGGWWLLVVMWLTFAMSRALSLLCGVVFRRRALLLTVLLSVAVSMGYATMGGDWIGALYKSAYGSPVSAAWLSLSLVAVTVCCYLLAYRLFCRIQIVGRKWISL